MLSNNLIGTPSRKKEKQEGNQGANLGTPTDAAQETKISFVCQRCLQPIRVEASFYSMNEHDKAELTLPLGYGRAPASAKQQQADYTDTPKCDDNPNVDRLVPPYRPLAASADTTTPAGRSSSGTTDHDFTLVGESGQPLNVINIRYISF